MIRRIGAAAIVGLLGVFLFSLTAGAVDTGVDQAWSEPMNHEPFWEAYFPGAECTKYERHSGVIPSGYEAVVVHDGQWVRVYSPVSGAFTALGPFNYNSPNPDDHFGAPHSWVMKCNIETTEETTSTVTEETTLPEETTLQETTTTTVQDSTTTTAGSTTSSTVGTTTTIGETTTTIVGTTSSLPPTSSSVPGSGELPFTGDHAARDAAIAGAALLMGVIVLTAAKGMKEDETE